MDTSTVPHASPALEPEPMMTLTLYCVEDGGAADQHPFAPDPYPRDAFEQLRAFITDPTSDILEFEGEEIDSRALHRFIQPH